MPERRVQMPFMGRVVSAAEVPVVNTSGTPIECELEDGTVIRIQTVVASVIRADADAAGYDPEGNPWYAVKTQPIITILSAPESLRRRLQ